jgi:membrane protease YdiL (CAAX protease family)
VALAAVVWAGSALALRLPPRWRAPVAVALSTVGVGDAALGSARIGLAAAASVSAGVAAASSVPQVRAAMARRELPANTAWWLLVRIPVGTVFAEEVVFRGALSSAARQGFGASGGRLFQAAVFGVYHIAGVRVSGEPVVGTIVVTAVAGWLFDWLRERSGGLAAPMLAHLAANEAGAVAALLIQSRRR